MDIMVVYNSKEKISKADIFTIYNSTNTTPIEHTFIKKNKVIMKTQQILIISQNIIFHIFPFFIIYIMTQQKSSKNILN